MSSFRTMYMQGARAEKKRAKETKQLEKIRAATEKLKAAYLRDAKAGGRVNPRKAARKKATSKKQVKRGGFGKTGRAVKNDVGKLFERGMKIIRGNPRTVEAVATRTIKRGEKFRIKV